MKLSYRNPKNAVAVAAYWGKALDKPDWYSINAQAGDTAEIFIYDVVGWPFNDIGGLVKAMAAEKDKPFLARINSPGGDVFDGISLYNAFASHPGGVTVRIEGLAASIASIIAMGGQKVEAYENTTFMIHNARAMDYSDPDEKQEIANIIKNISLQMADIYTAKTKTGKKEMQAMMKEETWMTARLAESKGFIDTVLANGRGVKAQFDLSVFSNCPDDLLLEEKDDPPVLTGFDVERILKSGGAPKGFAKAAAAACRANGLFDRSQFDNRAAIEECIAEIQKNISILGG